METDFFEGRAPTFSKDSNARRWQLIETFESTPESIWEDIHMTSRYVHQKNMNVFPDRFLTSRYVHQKKMLIINLKLISGKYAQKHSV
jgi:hypothetical protein